MRVAAFTEGEPEYIELNTKKQKPPSPVRDNRFCTETQVQGPDGLRALPARLDFRLSRPVSSLRIILLGNLLQR